MGFTEAQKVQIRKYLGWPATYLQVYSALEYAMSAAEQRPDTVTDVLATVTALQNIDGLITAAYIYIHADQVGEIKIGRMSEINILRSEGRRLVGRLASTLNVPVRHDVFSGSAPKGSNFLNIA